MHSKGAIKRELSTGDRVSLRRVFVQLDDIVSVSIKNDDNDVVMTLKNGVEYLLDELDEPVMVYRTICRYIVADEYEDED
mmetsp:Transcript_65464/g.96913  ORF Transcript_65464/g.96913 Transcript_65464/m.96913 type:complete len:80 (-) Transcript_65464:1385-1624(-)|eukprot:13471630-Ditylum_brightwellii.AAC.1